MPPPDRAWLPRTMTSRRVDSPSSVRQPAAVHPCGAPPALDREVLDRDRGPEHRHHGAQAIPIRMVVPDVSVSTPVMTRSLAMTVVPWQVPSTVRRWPGEAASTAGLERGEGLARVHVRHQAVGGGRRGRGRRIARRPSSDAASDAAPGAGERECKSHAAVLRGCGTNRRTDHEWQSSGLLS